MKVTPTHDRLLLRVIRDDKTSGGLYVPDIAFANSPVGRAEVLSAGPKATSASAGDVVWYAKPQAQPIPYDGEKAGDVVLIRDEGIVAVLTELDRATGLVGQDGEVLVIGGAA